MPKVARILRFIARAKRGRTLREIQEFIFRLNHPETPMPSNLSGYYTTNLFGGWTYVGILRTFCRKRFWRRYVVVEPIVAPFYRVTPNRTAVIGIRQLERRREAKRRKRQQARIT